MNTVKTTDPQLGTQPPGISIGGSGISPAKPANPYVGPRTFATKEREFFFGRDREAQDLLSVVITERLVLFYAQSGAGKSSLINTRLIPGLIDEEEYQVLPVGRLQGEPVKKNDVDNIYVYNLITSLIKRKVNEALVSKLTLSQFLAGLDYDDGPGYFYNESEALEPPGADRETGLKVVLIIDQFEELFTTHQEEWKKREDFFRQLSRAMEDFPNLSVVLAMRDDYVAVLEPYAYLLPGKLRGRYYMQRLGHKAAREAVERPAAKQGRPFVPEVAEKLVNDLSSVKVRTPEGTLESQPGQYVEPVQLQVICSGLWEKLDPKATQITQDLLEEYVGDVTAALGDYFAKRVGEVASDLKAQSQVVSEYEIRQWFETKLITSDNIRNMVAQVPGGKSGGLEDFVVQEFVRRGDLVRAEKRGGATFYELTHDRLVEPILQNNRDWFEEKSDLIQKRVILWSQQGRNANLLLRGRDLRAARQLAKTRPLTDEEKAFLESSVRQERTIIVLWSSATLAILVMLALLYIAVQQSRFANAQLQIALEQRQIADTSLQEALMNRTLAEKNAQAAENAQLESEEARNSAEEAKNIAEAQRSAAKAQVYQNLGDLYKSTWLALHSWSKSPSTEAEDILRENISFLPRHVGTFTQSSGIVLLEFNPNGKTFAAAGKDGSVCIWDIEGETKDPLFCNQGTADVSDLIFSPDGKYLVTGDRSGKVYILDPAGGASEMRDPNSEDTSPISVLDIGPDGKYMLIAREDGQITIMNLQSSRPMSYPLTVHGKVTCSVFSPDGKWVAAGTEGGSVVYWNLSSGYRYTRRNHAGKVLTLRFSPDTRYLVSGGEDNYAVLLDTHAERAMRSLAHLGPVREIAFGPDSSWFVTASDDRRIRIWDIPGLERSRILQEGGVTRLMVSPNGQLITALSADRTVRAWNAATGQEVFQIPLDVTASMVAFSQDGKYLVSGDPQGRLSVWDIFTLATPAKAITLSGMAENIQYNSAGALALSDENKVWVLPPQSLGKLSELPLKTLVPELPARVNRLALSPGSSYLGFATEKNDIGIIELYYGKTGKDNGKGGEKIKISVVIIGMGRRIYYPQGTVQDIAFSSDSSRFITLDSDGRVQGWSTNQSLSAIDFVKEGSGASAISIGPGIVAVGLPDKILIMDTSTGETLSETDAPSEHTLLAFSADGSLLADGDSSGRINLWEQQAGNLTLKNGFNFDKPGTVSLALAPDGRLLAFGTAENVHVINTGTGEEIARIPHVASVNDLSFSPDGKTLASASSDLIQFWDTSNIQTIKREDLVAMACSRMTKNLDKSQWSSLFGAEPYTTLCENLPVP